PVQLFAEPSGKSVERSCIFMIVMLAGDGDVIVHCAVQHTAGLGECPYEARAAPAVAELRWHIRIERLDADRLCIEDHQYIERVGKIQKLEVRHIRVQYDVILEVAVPVELHRPAVQICKHVDPEVVDLSVIQLPGHELDLPEPAGIVEVAEI